MEEENQAFGKDAEAVENNINLESEDFYFYNQNKEEAKKNIDSSSKDLTDFIDSLIQDIPAPSDEEVNAGIEKILKITHPEEQTKAEKTNKKKKVTIRVLFIAALLSILSASCLFVVGSNHDISLEKGFVAFAKDTIQIVFFGEDEEEYITVDTLLADLEAHGYGDILLPQEFVNNYDVYKASVPEYSHTELCDQVSFSIGGEINNYIFLIHNYKEGSQTFDYVDMDNVKTLVIDGINLYLFEFDDGYCAVEFVSDEFRYNIQSKVSCSEIVEIVKNIKE